jgi:aminoglycoside phosphotransferase (APT) family kinase protein
VKAPPEVATAVEHVLGAPVDAWGYVAAGHTQALKWFVPGAFVKAGAEPGARSQVEREAAVLAWLGDAPFTPRVRGFEQSGDYAVLVLEDLNEGRWPPPHPDRGEALFETLRRVAETTPAPFLPRQPHERPHGTYWSRLAEDPRTLRALVRREWLEPALPLLDEAESRAILHGDQLLHGDLWEGNTCYTDRGVVLVDWADALVGDPRVDLAYAIVSVRATKVNPAPVQLHDPQAYAALLAGANAWSIIHPPEVPGIGLLTTVHRRQLAAALAWAAELLGLPRP